MKDLTNLYFAIILFHKLWVKILLSNQIAGFLIVSISLKSASMSLILLCLCISRHDQISLYLLQVPLYGLGVWRLRCRIAMPQWLE